MAAVGAIIVVGDLCCNIANTKEALKYNETDPVLADRYGKADTISDTLRLNGHDEAAEVVDAVSSISATGVGVSGLLESAVKYAGKLGSIRDVFKNIFKFNCRNEQAEIRERVLKNIEESRRAREVSNYKEFAEFENRFNGISEGRLKYLETLKNGLVDDDAWKNLYKYAEKNDIDLGKKSFEWKLQKVEELKSEVLVDEDLMSVIQEKANNLLELSDNRLSDAMTSGYSAEDYYKVLNQEKSDTRAKEYIESLNNSNLINEWHNNFYGSSSKYVISYMSKNDYTKFVLEGKSIGRPGLNGGQFVLPESTADSIEANLADLGSISSSTTEFKTQLAKSLGLPENVYNSGVVRVQIPIDADIDLRIVSGAEDGCNYQWVPGTKTLGGTREGIIRQILESKDKDLYERIIKNSKVGN